MVLSYDSCFLILRPISPTACGSLLEFQSSWPKTDTVSFLFKIFPWIPITYKIKWKLLGLIHKPLCDLVPTYLLACNDHFLPFGILNH